MTKLEFETHLLMVEAMLESENYELLKQVIKKALSSSTKDGKKNNSKSKEE